LLTGFVQQDLVVDARLAEFVLDHGDAMPVLLLEDAVDEGGLSAPEEPGEYGHRNHVFLYRHFDLLALRPEQAYLSTLCRKSLRPGVPGRCTGRQKRAHYSTPPMTKQPFARHGLAALIPLQQQALKILALGELDPHRMVGRRAVPLAQHQRRAR